MPGAPAMSPWTPELSVCASHVWGSMPVGASGAPPPAELLKIHAFGCLRRCDLWLGHLGEALDELKVLHVLRLGQATRPQNTTGLGHPLGVHPLDNYIVLQLLLGFSVIALQAIQCDLEVRRAPLEPPTHISIHNT